MQEIDPTNAEKLALIRTMSVATPVYMALQYLERPAGAREIARLIDIDEHTAGRHLHRLEVLGLVKRLGIKQGYVLSRGGSAACAQARTVQNAQDADRAAADTARASSASGAGQAMQSDQSPQPDLHTPAAQNAQDAADALKVQQPPAAGASFASQTDASAGSSQEHVSPTHPRKHVQDEQITRNPENTTKLSQYPQNTTKFSLYRATSSTTTTVINLINLKDSVEVVVDQTTKKSQYFPQSAPDEGHSEPLMVILTCHARIRGSAPRPYKPGQDTAPLLAPATLPRPPPEAGNLAKRRQPW